MIYPQIYEFTKSGMTLFEKVFTKQLEENAIDPSDRGVATLVAGTTSLKVQPFATAKELAATVLAALGSNTVADLLHRPGIWAWLTFVLRDLSFPDETIWRP